MSDIRKYLNIISETTAGTTSGSVASVAQPMETVRRRTDDDYEEESTHSDTPEMPKVLEYGNWENSALTTSKKLKKARSKAKKIVKSIYGEDTKDIEETLHGKQSKLDANKSGSLDSEDFAMLRAGKKKVKESVSREDVAEGPNRARFRLIKTITSKDALAKVYKDSEQDEYVVTHYFKGNYQFGDDYYGDKEDCLDHAVRWTKDPGVVWRVTWHHPETNAAQPSDVVARSKEEARDIFKKRSGDARIIRIQELEPLLAKYNSNKSSNPSVKNNQQGVAENKLNEVDFASELGELSVPHEKMIDDSSVDGTIGTRKVQLYKSGKNKIYFFTDNKKIDALVYLFGDRVMGMKNFSANKGLIYNLFQYIVNIKKQKVRLTPEDKLTSDGIKWIIDQISRPNGFKITDTDGNKIDPKSLYDEWENARTSGTNGPTEIVIGESRNGKQIRENEIKLMPMDIFGATLKKIDEQLLSRVGMNNILEQDVAEAKKSGESTYWRVEQSEATGRYHVVTGHQKRKLWTNKMGAVDFNSKEAAQKKADELNQKEGVSEDLDANQKRVEQLGSREKVKNNNIGKLVGANESVEKRVTKIKNKS